MMQIEEIKSKVDLFSLAESLGIEIDSKTKRAHCPFHADKNPSLQFSKEKQIVTCFSSNCSAGTMDVIGLVEKKLNFSTHEALNYLKQMAGLSIEKRRDYARDFEQMQSSFLSSSTARNYLSSRAIDWKKLNTLGNFPTGYNAFKNSKFSYLKGCVTFGLRDEKGKVVSMYGRSVLNSSNASHFYTSNRKGLYPGYPSREARYLILTESVIDAATLLSVEPVRKEYEILALYGTNGLTTEHVNAIQKLASLEEIILWFDGDAAGKAAVEKHGKYLKELFPEIQVSVVNTPEGEDVNSLAQNYSSKNKEDDSNIFTHLLSERTTFLFSTEKEKTTELEESEETESGLNTSNPNKITYQSSTAVYSIKGGIRKDLDSLKVTLVIESRGSTPNIKSRSKVDLYEDKQIDRIAKDAADKLDLRFDQLLFDLNHLTDLLDQYRESTQKASLKEEAPKEIRISLVEKQKCQVFLKEPDLLPRINELIGKSGVVGEQNNRLFLFGIASSYKMEDTLHGLVQGSSGSGKTHLLASIMELMPEEDRISLTRVTESSFYNYGTYELQHKLIGIEDYDGLEEKAELAFRELQSKGVISSSTSGKDEQTGEIKGFIKTVYGPIASLSATTKGAIYEDNMSRCFLIAVDESSSQTSDIIRYQNEKAAGLISKSEEVETRTFLRNCIRELNSHQVINPFANRIELPKNAHKIRRLNELFQCYVKQITLLNQFQREKDNQGRLISEKEDVKTAIDIMFESIVLKVDELDGSLRSFYEELKSYVLSKGKEYEFSRIEIRQALQVSKTHQHRCLSQLIDLEYVRQSNGYANRGYQYKVQYWDNNEKLRSEIRDSLEKQLEIL